MRVQVTQQDIERAKHRKVGSSNNAATCPIAQAIRRQCKKKTRVYCTYAYVDEQKYVVSTRAQRFIKKFDDNMSVKPQNFEFTKFSDITFK